MESITWSQFSFIVINIMLVMCMFMFMYMAIKSCEKRSLIKFLFLVSCAFGTLYVLLELNIKLGGL